MTIIMQQKTNLRFARENVWRLHGSSPEVSLMPTNIDESGLQGRIAVLTEECRHLNQVVYEQNRVIFEHHRVAAEGGDVRRQDWPLYFGRDGTEADTISFAVSGNSDRFVKTGFGETEDGYRWTEQKESVLCFVLPEQEVRPYRLRMRARAFQTPQLKRQRVIVLVNDENCGTVTFGDMGVQTINFSSRGSTTVTLRCPDATSPEQAAISDDKRDLGVAVYSMAILPGRGRLFF